MLCLVKSYLPAVALAAVVLVGPVAAAGAQAPPPCAPGVAPAATIRGFDVEDGGGQLTATHTISLEARGRDGVVPGVNFTVPAGAQNRGDESNPAFSMDTPGPVPVTGTWSHFDDAAQSDCTASAQGTLRLRAAKAVTFQGVPRGPSFLDSYSVALRTGKNADLRPVQVRLRGVKRARLPGRGARVQRATIALRQGDAGLSRGESRLLRAAGWRFRIGNVDEHIVLFNAELINNRRGRRGPSLGFGYALQLVQARRRVGRQRAVGRCGYLGCSWRSL